jgi:hypothetical protein
MVLIGGVSFSPQKSNAQNLFASCEDARNYAFNQANHFGRSAFEAIKCDPAMVSLVFQGLTNYTSRFLVDVIEEPAIKVCAHMSLYQNLIDVIVTKFAECHNAGVVEFKCLPARSIGKLASASYKTLRGDYLGDVPDAVMGQTYSNLHDKFCPSQNAAAQCFEGIKEQYGSTLPIPYQQLNQLDVLVCKSPAN